MKFHKKRNSYEPRRGYVCRYCGAVGSHYSSVCFKRPRAPIRTESIKSRMKRIETAKEWRNDNPPDESGHWTSYLQISTDCPIILNAKTLTLEHVEARVRNPSRKYDKTNIRPACEFCNKLKGPWSLEQLAETYPQVRQMLENEAAQS